MLNYKTDNMITLPWRSDTFGIAGSIEQYDDKLVTRNPEIDKDKKLKKRILG